MASAAERRGRFVSAFRDLLEQAHAKGMRFIHFNVDLKDFFADEQNQSWRCYSWDNICPSEDFEGRTGEEALRHLVERL
jgi:hypothetical protein